MQRLSGVILFLPFVLVAGGLLYYTHATWRGKKWLPALAAGFLFANLFCSTVYWNYMDAKMVEMHRRFAEHDWARASCEEVYRSENGMEGGGCTGGLFQERDVYLAKKKVVTIGRWSTQGWVLFHSTFRPYFTWGF